MLYPNTTAPPDVPRLPAGEVGLKIQAPSRITARDRLIVAGRFQVPSEPAIDRHPHRGLVLVVTSPGFHLTRTPFRLRALFEDDSQRLGHLRAGGFQIDVFQQCGFRITGEVFLLCSVGTHTSNIVPVEIG